ncbi:MAG: D-alanyl-D-alanine carboxypeptidase [Candidatus Zixiibacteriota bacterium]|nr:MAG: D-alanyl-D-alanine carboxypeptidase [candidate division Zixibacteria bacterium]
MRRPGYFFAYVLLALLISRVEWSDLHWDLRKSPQECCGQRYEIPLRTTYKGQKAKESHEFSLRSNAAVVLDVEEGEILFEKNVEQKFPVASLTKLMSVLTFLETDPDLDDTAIITPTDAWRSGRAQLRVGEVLTLGDLLHASLMSSSNRATRALAHASGLSPSEFAAGMNRKAKELGLLSSFFCEPTGLDQRNRSSALDCARLLYAALQDSTIRSIAGKTFYQFNSLNGKKRRHRVGSTSKLLFSSLKVKGGKTGYNGASGWCLGTLVEGDDGKEIVAVVLGAPSKRTRFREIRSIVKWSIRENATGSEETIALGESGGTRAKVY